MEDEVQESMDQIDQLIAESQSGVNSDHPKVKRIETHICSDMLSVYEITQLIGYRAVTIENTGLYYCTIEHLSDLETEKLTAIGLAVLELQQKKCPLLIQRKVTPWASEVEIVNPNHMILP